MENVKQIKGYPMYTVDESGRVYSSYRPRYLKPNNNNGYMQVYLRNNDGVSRWHYVHRLVAEHFLEPRVSEMELWVNHEDGDKGNNHFSNLSWMTIAENIQHSVDTGLRRTKSGPDHWLYGKRNEKATGPKAKWMYILPGIGEMTYNQLRTVFPLELVQIADKCTKGRWGYSRRRI